MILGPDLQPSANGGYLAAAGPPSQGAGAVFQGRRDAKAKADLHDLKANAKTIEEVLRETPATILLIFVGACIGHARKP